jgi:hypothetical protein
MTLPWHAWLYLLLLAMIGAGGLVASRVAGKPLLPALPHVAAIVVFGAGVVFFHQRAGATTMFAVALFLATLLQARRSIADAEEMRRHRLPGPARAGVALRGLAVLPAIAMGAIAVWSQQGA